MNIQIFVVQTVAINLNLNPEATSPPIYQIRVRGHLPSSWGDWFDDLLVTLENNGDTLLTGPVVDQAALYGLLKKVRDLGLPLISVNCLTPASVELPPRVA
jgi:hypothetical protein